MKNKKVLRKYFIAGMAASTFSFASFAFADAPAAPAGPSAGASMIVAAIHDLSNTVQSIASADAASKNNDKYQPTPGQITVAQVNNEKSQVQVSQFPNVQGLGPVTNANASSKTENQNAHTLTQFSDAALTYTTQSEDVLASQNRTKARNNLANLLSWQTKASDSLYTDLLPSNAELSKPTDLHDNYFDFSSVFAPVAYTPDQKEAAEKFIAYLSQKYQSLAGTIDFGSLRQHLLDEMNDPKKGPTQVAADLKSFVTSPSYEQYQLAARTIITERSVALNNLNELIAERSPITTPQSNSNLAQLSQQIGVTPATEKDSKGNTVYAYASPLQISNYVTTHRTSDPNWYKQMMSASPATVQRETLFVLAEMESELQRQHIDNERILATLTASQMQNVTSQENNLKAMANDVNQQIQKISGGSQATTPNPQNAMSTGGLGNGTTPTSMSPPAK